MRTFIGCLPPSLMATALQTRQNRALPTKLVPMKTDHQWQWCRAVLIGSGMVFVLCGCAIHRQLDTQRSAYTYSAFDFSGDAYTRARKNCDAKGYKLTHVATDCGFFLCTSTFECSP